MVINFKRKKIAIFSIYNSPKNTYTQFEKHITSATENKYTLCQNIIILSNFNIQYNSNNYVRLCNKLSNYHLQHVTKYTTINNSTIYFAFTNLELHSINNFYAHWSDHYMIQLQLNT